MAENRYIGSYPVIGIRPTIDGRRGVLKVRESLEDQTMNMARAAAKLFEDTFAIPTASPSRSSSPTPPSAAWPRPPRAKRSSAARAWPSH